MDITGNKCRLRPLKKSDIVQTLRWKNDQVIIEKIGGYRFPVTEVMEDKWYDSVLNDESKTRAIFAIEDLNDDLMIGYILLSKIDWIARTAYIGITIGEKDKQSKGIGTDAIHILLKYGFEYFNLRKICLEVISYNIPAIKTYEKLGFKREGVMKNHFYLGNEYYDIILMALFKEDYYK